MYPKFQTRPNRIVTLPDCAISKIVTAHACQISDHAIYLTERPRGVLFNRAFFCCKVAMSQLSCSFSIYCGTECDFSSRWAGRQQLIPLNSCADGINEHLRGVNVSQTCVVFWLIFVRVGLFEDDFTICPKHQAVLGVRFRPSKKCQHPLHGNRKGKGERGVNLKPAKEIKEKWNTVVPVGAGN